jgi:hypothetical protein|tara:strand:+ start:1590 stop:2012 length:423 start_codon:yes stop_codon:yes gene_type:complete
LKVTGLNGREYNLNLQKYDVKANDKRKRSKHHIRARKLIKEVYHSYRVLEEVKLPGSTSTHKRSVLYLDFFIPNIRKAVEVHGRQHYEYTPFFHKSKADFILARGRDEDKIEWCELNNIEIITLKYSGSDDEWRKSIKGI